MGGTLIDKIDGLIRGHKISWEKRETHFHNNDWASEAFLSKTEDNRETRPAGRNGVHVRTPHMEGFQNSRSSWMEEGLLRLISWASLSRLADGGIGWDLPFNTTAVDEGYWLRNNRFYDITACSPGRHDCLTGY